MGGIITSYGKILLIVVSVCSFPIGMKNGYDVDEDREAGDVQGKKNNIKERRCRQG